MDATAFDRLIARLETRARRQPLRYTLSVAAVALLGFLILGVAVGFSLLLTAAFTGLVLLALKVGGGGVVLLALKLGKALVLLLVPAWMMLKSTWTMLTSRFPPPEGRELTAAEAPALFARLEDMRQRLQGPRFHQVLLTDEMNAAVVQHPRYGLLGGHRNYLILGLPLLQVMSEDEAMAVVAHEYGHLSGRHNRFGAFIYRLRNAWAQMQAMADSWTDWGSRLVARLFRWYAPWFNAYTFVLARQNEYDADRASAELVGVAPAASALARVNIASRFEQAHFWPAVNHRIRVEPEPPAARSQDWALAWREQLAPEQQQTFLADALTRVTDHSDTHPALADRLRALGVDTAALQPPVAAATSAAEAWLGPHLAAVQAEFDHGWRQAVTARWQEQHRHLQEQQQRLAALRARDTPGEDEAWQIIVLTEELEPETDLMPLLEALLARNDMETRRQQELDHLEPGQTTLVAADLGPEVYEAVAAVLRAHPKGIKRAWLLRRVIASDPEARAWVLALQTTAFTSPSAAQKICEQLARQTMPLPMHIIPLSTAAFARQRRQVKKLGLARLFP